MTSFVQKRNYVPVSYQSVPTTWSQSKLQDNNSQGGQTGNSMIGGTKNIKEALKWVLQSFTTNGRLRSEDLISF